MKTRHVSWDRGSAQIILATVALALSLGGSLACRLIAGYDPGRPSDHGPGRDATERDGDRPRGDGGFSDGAVDGPRGDGGFSDGAVDDAPSDVIAPDGITPDSGPPPGVVTARFPPNGHTTGSVHVPLKASVVDHPLKPKLMWNTAASATEYHVQITSECPVATFRQCAFATPAVNTRTPATTFRPAAPLPVRITAPVGRRYYWRVRACNAGGCSAFSTVRYLDVGRLRNDFNGDGYADLVIGAQGQNNPEPSEGTAYVYFGSVTGPPANPTITLDNPRDKPGGNFGISVASAGDLNGDGYADLVVGAPGQNNPEINEGNAYVYFGSATGPPATPSLTLDNPRDQALGGFGRSVASAGDVNGDGSTDGDGDLSPIARHRSSPQVS